jgi:methylglutaconyl-CoA hydratase
MRFLSAARAAREGARVDWTARASDTRVMSNDSAAALYAVEDGAAWITLNRPDRRNALSDELVDALRSLLERAIAEPEVRAVVLTGSGPAFCAGADLKRGGGGAVSTGPNPFVEILQLIADGPKPVIAAVNGAAFGGGVGLVAAADIAIAAADVKFSFSEVRIGVIPAMISVVVIPALGQRRAMQLFLTGERFSAVQAVEYGLLHAAVPAGDLRGAVANVVAAIAKGGPNSIREAKQLVRRVPTMTRDEAFAWTQRKIADLFASQEAIEGMTAFAEKRPPSWIR